MPTTRRAATAAALPIARSEIERLERMRQLGDLLDSRWRIPFTPFRIGVDGIASLVPVVGDTATAVVAAYLVMEATRFRVPAWLLGRMAANVGLDWLVGSVPVVGTLFDIGFKANNRNLALLTRYLEQRHGLAPSRRFDAVERS